MLNPLTEVVIGVCVAVGIGGGQFMVHIQSDRERGEPEKHTDQRHSHS